MELCLTCGRELTRDEIALSKKIINRGAAEFKCAACLSAYYRISEQRLHELIAHYRAQGCTLFDE